MSPRRDHPAAVDRPEPEDVLSEPGPGAAGVPADDREVLLDEPATPDPPIDDEDRVPDPDGPGA